ncbi:MAG: hypothetical protein AB7F86_19700 [Bdellovibrionales bacterium]
MTVRSLTFLIFLFPFAGSAGEVVDVQNKSYWLCKNRKDVRTIRVAVDADGMCTTLYSKLGSEKSIGSGRNLGSCINFLENVRTNLEKSNWACRDITPARITASVAEKAE